MAKQDERAAAPKLLEVSLNKLAQENVKKKKAPYAGQPGVLFWLRLRVDGAGGPPRYFDRPEDVPEKLLPKSYAPDIEFLRIEYPPGSGNHLRFHGSRRIADREVIIALLIKSKPKTTGKTGHLLYDATEVLEQGWLTPEELHTAAVGSVHPDKDPLGTMTPPPDFAMLSESELDKFAKENKVYQLVDYEVTDSKVRKEQALARYHRMQAEKTRAEQG